MNATFVFAVWPYVAVAVFAAGMAVRYGSTRAEGLSGARELFAEANWWRLSLLLLFVGHLAGLLFPRQVVAWDSAPSRLYLLEGVSFMVGMGSLAGWARLTWRHLGRSGGSTASQLADTAFLSMSLVAMLSGVLTAILYRWGSSWGASTLTPYAWSLLSGNPVIALAAELPFFIRLHVFSSLAVVAMIPATRLAPVLLLPVHNLLALLGKGVLVPARAVQNTLEFAVEKYDPSASIWPEEN